MLQQTQASRVQEKLPLFLKKFPTLKKLSQASKADVLRAWQGLGYNNRAVRLHEFAKIVIEKYKGKIPHSVETLKELPGIGMYTAHALACFAFRQRVAVVDVNIRRVLSRMFWNMKTPNEVQAEKTIWQFAEKILPNDAYIWNQALMDIGSTICLARKPRCTVCPVKTFCRSSQLPQSPIRNRQSNIRNSEPSYLGLPRRLWRGKIVEALRSVNGKGRLSIHQLAREIHYDLNNSTMSWLQDVLRQLEKDTIITQRKRGTTVYIGLAHK